MRPDVGDEVLLERGVEIVARVEAQPWRAAEAFTSAGQESTMPWRSASVRKAMPLGSAVL